jgi:hypothetical protein
VYQPVTNEVSAKVAFQKAWFNFTTYYTLMATVEEEVAPINNIGEPQPEKGGCR